MQHFWKKCIDYLLMLPNIFSQTTIVKLYWFHRKCQNLLKLQFVPIGKSVNICVIPRYTAKTKTGRIYALWSIFVQYYSLKMYFLSFCASEDVSHRKMFLMNLPHPSPPFPRAGPETGPGGNHPVNRQTNWKHCFSIVLHARAVIKKIRQILIWQSHFEAYSRSRC